MRRLYKKIKTMSDLSIEEELNMQIKEIRLFKEENERLKQWKLEAEEQLDLQHELNKSLKEKDFFKEFTNAYECNQRLISERDSLKQLISELVEALDEMFNTLRSPDIFLSQSLPTHESNWHPENWLKKTEVLLLKAKDQMK